MTQKKVSTGINSTAAVLELDENDELIESVTTTKTLGRRKRKEEPLQPAETDDGPPTDFIDVVDDEDDPGYSETSIAARLFGYRKDGREDFSSHHCTAIIRREPDDMRDSFMVPCSRQTYIGKIPAISITTNEEDLADRIREMNGGGNYTVQYHYGGKIQSEALAITIADDRNKIASASSAAATTQPAASNAPPPVTVDPFDAMLASVDKFAKIKEVFGGGDVDKIRMEFQIAEMRREIEAAKAAPQERKSERLTLFEAALAAGANNPLQTKILDNLFPSEEKGERHWAAEMFEVAIQNKDTIFEVVGPLLARWLGGGVPQPRPAAPPQYVPQQTPLPPPPLPASGLFARREPEPPPDESEPGTVVTGDFTPQESDTESKEPEPDAAA